MTLQQSTVCGLMLGAGIRLLAGGWIVPQERLQDQPRFRTGVDMVFVPVLVRQGREFVNDLAPVDFALYDDGALQQITVVSSEAVPLDVTLLVDASSSVRAELPKFRDSVKRLTGLLRTDDRLAVLSFATRLEQIIPLQAPAAMPSFDRIQAAGTTAVHDALAQVMMIGGVADRRRLIVALTDGRDNRSAISPATLLEVARRYDGSIHMVPLGSSFHNDGLRQAAGFTGGDVYETTSPEGLARRFEEIFVSERRSYLLGFIPFCGKGPGWHEIRVAIARQGAQKYTVRARQGYFAGPVKQ
jgi:VWFA-related protein